MIKIIFTEKKFGKNVAQKIALALNSKAKDVKNELRRNN